MVENEVAVMENEAVEPDFNLVVGYGIVADLMVVVPIILYMLLDGTNGYSKHHQTMINMMTSSWMPFAVVWIIVAVNDNDVSRMALTGALEMAALGPFALMWVGYMAFLMSAQASSVLNAADGMNIVFAILYPLLNIGLIIMHWYVSEGIYNWIQNAPFPSDEVDEPEAELEDEPEDEPEGDLTGEEFEEESAVDASADMNEPTEETSEVDDTAE